MGGSGFDSQARINTQCLTKLRNEGTPFALQAARPSRGSDDHVTAVPSPEGDVNIVSPVSTSVLNTMTLKESALFFNISRGEPRITPLKSFSTM